MLHSHIESMGAPAYRSYCVSEGVSLCIPVRPHALLLHTKYPLHTERRTMQLLLCLLAFFLAGLIPSVTGFLVAPCSPLRSSRQSCRTAAALQAQEDDASSTAPPGSSDDACPGYPRCSGEYRDKGCDGTGRWAICVFYG